MGRRHEADVCALRQLQQRPDRRGPGHGQCSRNGLGERLAPHLAVFIARDGRQHGHALGSVRAELAPGEGQQLAFADVPSLLRDHRTHRQIVGYRVLQGHGHGKHLLEWGLMQARTASMNGMLLEVRPSNLPAKALYEKSGFKLIGVRKNYYPAKAGREDALVFLKRFT